MTTVACVVIASEHRRDLVASKVWPSVMAQTVPFDKVVLVGDWVPDGTEPPEYLRVEPLTRTTTDALVKRDVGTLCADADIIVYLCDDHALNAHFAEGVRSVASEPWDVIVPNRATVVAWGQPPIPLNNGETEGYCGGHCGVYRRWVVSEFPWSAGPHHPNWDVLISQQHIGAGARYVSRPRHELTIYDLRPEDEPWRT